MQANIKFKRPIAKAISTALKAADKKNDALKKAYFHLVNEGKLQIVVGNKSEMSCFEIETLTVDEYINCDAFSLPADAVADAISMCHGTQDIEIVLTYSNGGACEVTFSDLNCYRLIKSSEAEKVHIEYLEKSKLNTFTSIPRANFSQLLYDLDKEKPLEAVQVSSTPETPNLVKMKIQRDGDIFLKDLAYQGILDIDFFMDERTYATVHKITNESHDEFINISSQFNNLVIKTECCAYSFTTTGADEFLQKKVIKTESEIDFFVNAYKLKKEVSSYIKLSEIKHQEQVFLLFNNGFLMFCSMSEHVVCAKIFKLNCLSSIEFSGAFTANLNILNKLKVKDVTTFHEMYTALTKTDDGKYNLSFFNKNDKNHPFYSVSCTSVPNQKKDLIKIFDKYPALSTDWGHEDNENMILDLF
ncbi:hypothetical protein [Psychromonas aquatilis]|uniref:DNA polymerase III beta sliding clamp subunit n=1 Tax=Psychromonas aquatilis TaxID=2005072 RepID=A0ABU9GTM6_9GAMM